jgi:hypothetical protein
VAPDCIGSGHSDKPRIDSAYSLAHHIADLVDYKGRFHTSSRPWTTWHAPLIGPCFLKRWKVLSHGGPSNTTQRTMTHEEARG